jgi:endonuclease G
MLIPPELVQQTRARYGERSERRADNIGKLKEGTPLQADTPDRVERRVARLASTEVARERPAASFIATPSVPSTLIWPSV